MNPKTVTAINVKCIVDDGQPPTFRFEVTA